MLPRSIIRPKRKTVWIVLATVVGVLLCMMPLTNRLGYQFALNWALFASFMGANLAFYYLQNLRLHQTVAISPFPLLGSAIKNAAIPFFVGPVIVFVNTLRIGNCDWGFPILTLFALPAISYVFATILGLFLSATFHKHKFAFLIPYFVILATGLWAFIRFYYSPAIFRYGSYFGYFTGNLYDTTVHLQGAFWWSRLLQLALHGLLFSLLGRYLSPTRGVVAKGFSNPAALQWNMAIILCTLLSTGLLLMATSFRIEVTQASIKKHLVLTHTTKHFRIHYPANGAVAHRINTIADDHEFSLAVASQRLGISAPSTPIDSYYFASTHEKYKWIGAKNFYLAKPWQNAIFMDHSPFPHPVLTHEIAHVLAGQIGDPIFGISADGPLGLPTSFNVMLVEGIAVAAAAPADSAVLHRNVHAMLQMKKLPRISDLFHDGFFKLSASQSYTVAGSMFAFVLDRYGKKAAQTLFRSAGNFRGATGKSQEAIVNEWLTHIKTYTVSPRELEILQERYRHPGVFNRVCPDSISKRKEKVRILELEQKWSAAVQTYDWICAKQPGEPRHQIEQGRLRLRSGDTQGLQQIQAVLDNPQVNDPTRFLAIQTLVEYRMTQDQADVALKLLENATKLLLSENQLRQLHVQIHVLKTQIRSLYDYNWDPRKDWTSLVARSVSASLTSDSSIARYLAGRLLSDTNPKSAYALLRTIDPTTLAFGTIEREYLRVLTRTAYLVEEWDAARDYACRLGEISQRPEDHEFAASMRTRLAWKKSKTLEPAQCSPSSSSPPM